MNAWLCRCMGILFFSACVYGRVHVYMYMCDGCMGLLGVRVHVRSHDRMAACMLICIYVRVDVCGCVRA